MKDFYMYVRGGRNVNIWNCVEMTGFLFANCWARNFIL